ncbi:MAG: TRAP transporter small permease subunit [Desulfarculaceae bacterium]|jgi:TRAP-type mannitol/chloroaromatic compound transport system permease small subunit
MAALKAILAAIDKINHLVAKLVSWVIVFIMAATVFEVVMRYVFDSPTEWVFEFNYLLHGPYFLIVGAYTFALGGHVNVDIFYGRFSPRARAIIDLFTAPIFFFFMAMMFWHGGKFALNSLALRETLSSAWAPPVYPVKLMIPLAAAMVVAQGLVKFSRDLHHALTGREGEL